MFQAVKLKEFLEEYEANEALIDLVPSLSSALPAGVDFNSDEWDLLPWLTRKGNAKTFNINYYKFNNNELKKVLKLYVLEKRINKKVSANSINIIINSLVFLDQAIGLKPLKLITNSDFEIAEELIEQKCKKSAVPRYVDFLVVFGRWISSNFGFRISFTNSQPSIYQHGRKATDKERDNKLIDFRIIVDLIDCLHREDLSDKDRFYLLILVLFVGTGFRINELATLPKDCLINENNRIGIRHYPEKKAKLSTRWISSEWAPAVQDAINNLTDMTGQGRKAVAELHENPGLDWSSILQNEQASEYFVAKFANEWTSNPRNYMFSKEGAWLEKEKRYIDVIGLVETTGSHSQAARESGLNRRTISILLKQQTAARQNKLPPRAKGDGKLERTSWDTDSRVISIMQLEQYINLAVKSNARSYIVNILNDARDSYQLKGHVYPCPEYNNEFETKFKRVINPVIVSKAGKPILQPEDALLVTLKYQLSDARNVKESDYYLITDSAISRWMSGEIRSLGTKNTEDSCFSRLGIVDPKTNEIAKFTSHDIRHWFTTFLLEGGMPSDQVALLMNRSPNQNDTYDQTSSRTRLNNMREAIRNGGAIGHVSDVYHDIAEYSRDEAEQYLKASTLQLNLMPHGGCSLSWGMKACENHHGCFNGENGLCENLCIDIKDEETQNELLRMMGETKSALSIIPEQSPQHNHYYNIQRNLQGLLEVVDND